jgi:hypothetical protein
MRCAFGNSVHYFGPEKLTAPEFPHGTAFHLPLRLSPPDCPFVIVYL